MIDWVLAGFSLLGVYMNIKKLKVCFAIWFFTNMSWFLFGLYHGHTGFAFLMFIYTGLAVYGYREWSK